MKKLIAIFLCLIMVFSVGALSVSAAEKDDVKLAKEKADYADYFFDGFTVGYVVTNVSFFFVNMEDELFDHDTMTQPFNGDTVNKYLNENFVLSGDMLSKVQKELGYDANTNIYHLPFMGGWGGMNRPREYVDYVKNKDKTYSLYYQTIDWLKLPDSEYKKIEAENKWPDSVEYNGKTYNNTSEGYYCKNGYKDGGLVHTLDIKNGIARFISTEKFTGNKVPATPKPTDKEENKNDEENKDNANDNKEPIPEVIEPTQVITQTEGLVLQAMDTTFEKDTVVKAEKIAETEETYKKAETALKKIVNKFVAYEITATKNNVTVQPNGEVTATFNIPADFNPEKTTVYYVSDDGKIEELKTTVYANTRKVTASLTHFSTYVVAEKIVVDVNDGDLGDNGDSPISPFLIIAIVVLAVVAGAVYLVIKFKRR